MPAGPARGAEGKAGVVPEHAGHSLLLLWNLQVCKLHQQDAAVRGSRCGCQRSCAWNKPSRVAIDVADIWRCIRGLGGCVYAHGPFFAASYIMFYVLHLGGANFLQYQRVCIAPAWLQCACLCGAWKEWAEGRVNKQDCVCACTCPFASGIKLKLGTLSTGSCAMVGNAHHNP